MKPADNNNRFEHFASRITTATGSSAAFMAAVSVVIVWAVCGPIFHYSETWQLVINTGTTIITFVMVFLIQKTQNKDSKALHLKIDELLSSIEGSSNRLVDIEYLNEAELDELHEFYKKISEKARKRKVGRQAAHSIDEKVMEKSEEIKNRRKK